MEYLVVLRILFIDACYAIFDLKTAVMASESNECPDLHLNESCEAELDTSSNQCYFECPNHGEMNTLHDNGDLTDDTDILKQALEAFIMKPAKPPKPSDLIKVNGLSNYQCKLLSHLLTRYCLSREGKVVPIERVLEDGKTFNCGRLRKRAFLISPEHMEISGFGRDETGSARYLGDVLETIRKAHGGEERLIPIHADGDGHCLVHALSRATTGREIFWHALRENLVNHLQNNFDQYRMLLKDFIDEDDWTGIIKDANTFQPNKENEVIPGLGSVHIFALSNVLKRPIVLLDSVECLNSVAEYAAIFVPALVEPTECCENMPLCIAWSGSAHNHFVPLVGVTGRPLPTIPKTLLPNVWGIDGEKAEAYLNFNEDGSLTVGGGRLVNNKYMCRLVKAMEDLFLEKKGVSVNLVCDMHRYVFGKTAFVSLQPEEAVKKTVEQFEAGMIFRCLECKGISTYEPNWDNADVGIHSPKVKNCNVELTSPSIYTFKDDGVSYQCDEDEECIQPYWFETCNWCRSCKMRKVDKSGNIIYQNGDPTETCAETPSCCEKKHFWDGREYEKLPKQFILKITFHGITIKERVTWFYDDCRLDHNTNGETIAEEITEKHFSKNNSLFFEVQQKILKALLLIISHEHDEETRLVDTTQNSLLNTVLDTSGQLPISSLSLNKNPVDDIPSEKLVKRKSRNVRRKDGALSEFTISPNFSEKNKPTVQQLPIGDESIKIRIWISPDQHKVLRVDKLLDYAGLQHKVQTHFFVKPERQVLKIGFPPKVIEDKGEDVPLGLERGDRVIVETTNIIDEKRKKKPTKPPRNRSEAVDKPAIKSAKVLRDLHPMDRRTRHTGANVDNLLKVASNTAKINKLSEWEYATGHPELFRAGGAYYEQFSLDIGLEPGRHCELPSMPGMVFCYNVTTDEIELCLDQKGHHSIGPKITEIIHAVNSDCDQKVHGNVCSGVDQSNKENTVPPFQAADSIGERIGAEQGTQDEGATHVEETVEQDEDKPAANDDNPGLENFLYAEDISRSDGHVVIDEKSVDNATTKIMKRLKGDREKTIVKIPKLAPSFTIVGSEPTVISPEEAKTRREELFKVLCSRKAKNKM